MNNQEKDLLKQKIDKAKLISFDIFDTLLFRKTNTPETVFDLVGKQFGIHGFRKLRMDGQQEASRRAQQEFGYPHADMEQIYDVMKEHTEIAVDWDEVKLAEIAIEKDTLTANEELLEIFRYAKETGKRVVATSDMYLLAETLKEILSAHGFEAMDHVYCSADERKAKFNRELFELVAEKENVAYEDILHIGDKGTDDGEIPASFGIDTFVYNRDCDLEKVKHAVSSEVHHGLYKILYNKEKGFWYNLGMEVGGPLYLGLYQFLLKKLKESRKKIYFLSRDGYYLYRIFKNLGYDNVEYLYVSRRSLTLASIDEINEAVMDTLPPYVDGQTIGEILDYLCIDRNKIKHLAECGFQSFDDVIDLDRDKEAFRKLYLYDKDVFLERCKTERENAKAYFETIGFFDQDSICFDCGWQGSSQDLIERFRKVSGYTAKQEFVYFGILNTKKSRRQLRGFRYDTYLFDFYKNYTFQQDVEKNVILYELFFSAPHESVFYYGEGGTVVLEDGNGDQEKEEMLKGISDYILTGLPYVEKYNIVYTPEHAVGSLKRLIASPTEEEAVHIGNLQNVDGFARKQGEAKYIAYTTMEQLSRNPKMGTYWLEGLLKRPDISDEIKIEVASRYGVAYPKGEPVYHLKNDRTIRNYHRWIKNPANPKNEPVEWNYKPMISIIVPVYNVSTEYIDATVQSILRQTYDQYELILINDASSWGNVDPALKKYESNEHVRLLYRDRPGRAANAINDGIEKAQGEYLTFVSCGDTLESHALYAFASHLNTNPKQDFLYSDEDSISEDGKVRKNPQMKPDWSKDLLLTTMYTGHMALYRTSIAKQIGGLRDAYNGSHEYDFVLRLIENIDASRIGHIPAILYHSREQNRIGIEQVEFYKEKTESARNARMDYFRRNDIRAEQEDIVGTSASRIVYEVTGEPFVSVIVLSRGQKESLKRCVDSIRQFTDYKHYEILVAEAENETDDYVTLCRKGVSQAKGDYFLFIEETVEIFQSKWLDRLIGQAQQAHTGAVGVKLFHPQTTQLYHSGMMISGKGVEPRFSMYDDKEPQYLHLNWIDGNSMAVSSACMMVSSKKYHQVGGFRNEFHGSCGAADFCLNLYQHGYLSVIRNDVVVYSHEVQMSPWKQKRQFPTLIKDSNALMEKFYTIGEQDPFFNEEVSSYWDELGRDHLEEIKLSGCEPADQGQIEKITIDSRIKIEGWSNLRGEEHIEELERYLIFKDPYGNTYAAMTSPCLRTDVVEYFGNKKYLYSGFECVLSFKELRLDLMPYQCGILTIGRRGKRYVKWCEELKIVQPKNMEKFTIGNRSMDFNDHTGNSDGLIWNLETCEQRKNHFYLSGYAFKSGMNHHLYQTCIVLSDSNGKSFVFDTKIKKRLDVACAYPKEKFLYDTGFECHVLTSMLEAGQKYEVKIRLRHVLNSGATKESYTGQTISL